MLLLNSRKKEYVRCKLSDVSSVFTEGSKAGSIALDFCGLVLIFDTFFVESYIPLKEVSLRYCCYHLKLLILNSQIEFLNAQGTFFPKVKHFLYLGVC